MDSAGEFLLVFLNPRRMCHLAWNHMSSHVMVCTPVIESTNSARWFTTGWVNPCRTNAFVLSSLHLSVRMTVPVTPPSPTWDNWGTQGHISTVCSRSSNSPISSMYPCLSHACSVVRSTPLQQQSTTAATASTRLLPPPRQIIPAPDPGAAAAPAGPCSSNCSKTCRRARSTQTKLLTSMKGSYPVLTPVLPSQMLFRLNTFSCRSFPGCDLW